MKMKRNNKYKKNIRKMNKQSRLLNKNMIKIFKKLYNKNQKKIQNFVIFVNV